MSTVYVFDAQQLDELLSGTIDMFLEYRDHHAKTEDQAKLHAVIEMVEGLEAERELAADDPNFFVSSQIIPTLVECSQVQP